jgi:hypothetical protein
MRAETNTSILGLLSREDGMLLKADVPARSVDHTWLQKVYGGSPFLEFSLCPEPVLVK